jgi:hypothetical protein
MAAGFVLLRDDGNMLDMRLWSLVMFVQGIPYLATVLVSIASSLPHLVGPMGKIRCSTVA